jgi:hypothetical protein
MNVLITDNAIAKYSMLKLLYIYSDSSVSFLPFRKPEGGSKPA